jgi:hypothetical protein
MAPAYGENAEAMPGLFDRLAYLFDAVSATAKGRAVYKRKRHELVRLNGELGDPETMKNFMSHRLRHTALPLDDYPAFMDRLASRIGGSNVVLTRNGRRVKVPLAYVVSCLQEELVPMGFEPLAQGIELSEGVGPWGEKSYRLRSGDPSAGMFAELEVQPETAAGQLA